MSAETFQGSLLGTVTIQELSAYEGGSEKFRNIRQKNPSLIDCLHIEFGLANQNVPNAAAGIMFYLSGTLFSAFHILAWNWEFPSPAVRMSWRVFALVATCAPLCLLLCTKQTIGNWDGIVLMVLIEYGFMFIYVVARVGLLVLIFYCFSSMPVGVYQTVEWTKFLPHFS